MKPAQRKKHIREIAEQLHDWYREAVKTLPDGSYNKAKKESGDVGYLVLENAGKAPSNELDTTRESE